MPGSSFVRLIQILSVKRVASTPILKKQLSYLANSFVSIALKGEVLGWPGLAKPRDPLKIRSSRMLTAAFFNYVLPAKSHSIVAALAGPASPKLKDVGQASKRIPWR
jgi:hypothetical protein